MNACSYLHTGIFERQHFRESLYNNEYTMTAFLDIEGFFYNVTSGYFTT